MANQAGVDLEPAVRVLRVVKNIPKFVPDGKPPINGAAFEPSSDDERDAVRTGQPVRVSVWNLDLTSVVQALAFRQVGIYLPFSLTVADVLQVKEMFCASRLRVVSDPLILDQRPGWEGHAGIEGLDRPKGEPGLMYKAVRDELARRATLESTPASG